MSYGLIHMVKLMQVRHINLTESVSLTLEAINLTDEEVVQYNTEKDRVMSIYANGLRLVAGIRVNF